MSDRMVKIAAAAKLHPGRRSLAQFQSYWAQSHGPLFANTSALRRYVQHLTLPEAYDSEPEPSWDGLSMFWYDTPDAFNVDSSPPAERALREAVIQDDRQLFDRLPGWPLDAKRASVVATERVIIEGKTGPEMVKALFVVTRKPGLTHQEFFDHWHGVHGRLAENLPGLRRYVQNHAIVDVLPTQPMTHDGFSEMWFDDLATLHAAVRSQGWRVMRDDGATLFANPIGVVVARERIQKEIDVPLPKKEAASMSEHQILARLREQGYRQLAADTSAPGRIKAAAASGHLKVWTPEHLVIISDTGIELDARPDR